MDGFEGFVSSEIFGLVKVSHSHDIITVQDIKNTLSSPEQKLIGQTFFFNIIFFFIITLTFLEPIMDVCFVGVGYKAIVLFKTE